MFRGNLASLQVLYRSEKKYMMITSVPRLSSNLPHIWICDYLTIGKTIDFQDGISCWIMQNILKGLVDYGLYFRFVFRVCLKTKYLIILDEILLFYDDTISEDRQIKPLKSLMNLHNMHDLSLRQKQLLLSSHMLLTQECKLLPVY